MRNLRTNTSFLKLETISAEIFITFFIVFLTVIFLSIYVITKTKFIFNHFVYESFKKIKVC